MTPCRRCNDRPAQSRSLCKRCYKFVRRREVAYGRWESLYVDAEPARQHVVAMRAAGVGRRRLSALTGVSENVIQQLVIGRRDRNEPPRRQITRRCSDAILAVPVPDVPGMVSADCAVVCAVGATRRLRALVAAGYQMNALTPRLGVHKSSVSRVAAGDPFAKASTVRAVRELFDELQLTPGPSDRARRYAASRGWPLPLDWDEDTIDDPTTEAHRSTTQPGAHRATEVAQIAERRALVADLTGRNLSASEIAERLGVDARTVVRDRGHTPAEAC